MPSKGCSKPMLKGISRIKRRWIIIALAVSALALVYVEALIAAMREDKSKDVRRSAAEALGDIGDDRAIPSLEAMRTDENEGVRKAAALALKKISEAGSVK